MSETPLILPAVRPDVVDHITRHVADTLTENLRAQEVTSAEAEIICAVLLGVLSAAQKQARRNHLELAFRTAVCGAALAAACDA